MSIREVLGSFPGAALIIGLVLGGLWAWEQRRKRRLRGLDIDTQDPIWTAAIARARDALPRFRELAAERPNHAFVKYPLQTTAGAVEHVWGQVLAVKGDTIVANIETPPVDGAPAAPPPYNLSLFEVEDWRVESSDGKIYGAYTARAQFEYARKHGHDIPAHMLEVERRLVDA